MEYRDVMDIKIQLDSEIAADRSLLECENRPSISMVESAMWYGRVSTQTQARRIRLETDSGARSLVQESRSASDFSVLTMSKDALEVTDVNAKTKFIKVFNTSSYWQGSTNWKLAAETCCWLQTAVYKFRRNIQLTITIWSSDAEHTHTPPSYLVMKEH